MDTDLRGCTLNQLRAAIQANAVSFPSPTPMFVGREAGHIQWRMAHLFFLAGWSLGELGRRYQMPPWRASLLVRDWADRVIALHLVERIPEDPEWPVDTPPVVVEFHREPLEYSGAPVSSVCRNEPVSRSKKRYSARDIAATLQDFRQGRSVQEICRKYGVASRTFYAWRKQEPGSRSQDSK